MLNIYIYTFKVDIPLENFQPKGTGKLQDLIRSNLGSLPPQGFRVTRDDFFGFHSSRPKLCLENGSGKKTKQTRQTKNVDFSC